MISADWSSGTWFIAAGLCTTAGLVALRLDTTRGLVNDAEDNYGDLPVEGNPTPVYDEDSYHVARLRRREHS